MHKKQCFGAKEKIRKKKKNCVHQYELTQFLNELYLNKKNDYSFEKADISLLVEETAPEGGLTIGQFTTFFYF